MKKFGKKFDEFSKVNIQQFQDYIKNKQSSLPIPKELNNINS